MDIYHLHDCASGEVKERGSREGKERGRSKGNRGLEKGQIGKGKRRRPRIKGEGKRRGRDLKNKREREGWDRREFSEKVRTGKGRERGGERDATDTVLFLFAGIFLCST